MAKRPPTSPPSKPCTCPACTSPCACGSTTGACPTSFAANDHDLYYAQGYLTARDRLWQMEFMTRVAAGRISEVVGPKALEYDRFQRRMGLGFGAENSLREMMQNDTTRLVLESYSAGVNAYISQLRPADYPFEYKLLDYAPEPWQPLKCALLLKLMAWDLSGRSDDLRLSNILSKYGPEVTRDLFPDYPFRADPVVPEGTPLDFTPLPVPVAPPLFGAAVSGLVPSREPDAELGSNNFAVAGSRSASGLPLLANDPHLQLNLPSIWYQIQLSAPGQNVYGVTIPGAPAVIIGFNENVAWGVTNVGGRRARLVPAQVQRRHPARILARRPLETGAPGGGARGRARPPRRARHRPLHPPRPGGVRPRRKALQCPDARAACPALDRPRRGQRGAGLREAQPRPRTTTTMTGPCAPTPRRPRTSSLPATRTTLPSGPTAAFRSSIPTRANSSSTAPTRTRTGKAGFR